jgi:hypothetical protein
VNAIEIASRLGLGLLAVCQAGMAAWLLLSFHVPPFRQPLQTEHLTVILGGVAFTEDRLLIPVILLVLGALGCVSVAVLLGRRAGRGVGDSA